MGGKRKDKRRVLLAKATQVQQKKPAQADISDQSVLQTVKQVQNCTMKNLHERLIIGKIGGSSLELSRVRNRLLEIRCLEKSGPFVYRITLEGEDHLDYLLSDKKGQLQPA